MNKKTRPEIIAGQIKKDVSEILNQALTGLNEKYLHRHSPHYAPYTKWGTVENDIHEAIDRHLKSNHQTNEHTTINPEEWPSLREAIDLAFREIATHEAKRTKANEIIDLD